MNYKSKTSIFLMLLSLIVLNCGCVTNTTKQLGIAKELYKNEKYEELSMKSINCDISDKACGQLHLKKGDGCYQLAKRNSIEQKKNYMCAVDEYKVGLEQGDTLGQGDRSQYNENMWESLRNLRDLTKAEESEKYNTILMISSQSHLEKEPGDICAGFFFSNAKHAQLAPCLLQPGTCPTICRDLTLLRKQLNDFSNNSAESHCASNIAVSEKQIATEIRISNCIQ